MIVAQLFAGLAELEFRGYVAAVRASGEAFPEAFTLAAPTPLMKICLRESNPEKGALSEGVDPNTSRSGAKIIHGGGPCLAVAQRGPWGLE